MATYDMKRCPACQKVYEKNFYSGKPKPEEKIRYGSPIRVCPSCGHEFIDADYREIALEGIPNEADYKPIMPGTILYTLLAFGLALFAFFFEFHILPFFFLGLGVIIIGSDLFSYQKRKRYLEQEIQRSKVRIQDPAYLEKLVKYGYPVPMQYRRSTEIE